MNKETLDIDLMLRTALDIGQNLWVYGADVRRVEDAVSRICKSYGVEHIEVFCIANSAVVSLGNVESGIYMVRVETANGEVNGRINVIR